MKKINKKLTKKDALFIVAVGISTMGILTLSKTILGLGGMLILASMWANRVKKNES